MLEQKASEKATALSETEDGKVTVVCTPTGGAKTIRLELQESWEEMSEEDLAEAIAKANK